MNSSSACTGALQSGAVPLDRQRSHPSPWLVLAAFAAVYIIWGSTYLGIRIAIDTIPPFLMAGSRFLIAGLVLYQTMRVRGDAPAKPGEWKSAAIIGALLVFAGNGGVTYAEKSVPSNVTALMIAAVPLWMNLLDWLRPDGTRPRPAVFAGLALGFAGVALIVCARDQHGHSVIDPFGASLLVLAPICWAIGSIYSRHAPQNRSALLNVGMQMICGGVLMMLTGIATGELGKLDLRLVSAASWWAYVYLTIVGSLIGFTAYVWLLQVSTPARVSTYAYVNPFVAVILGKLVLGEPLHPIALAAGALILVAVALITTAKSRG